MLLFLLVTTIIDLPQLLLAEGHKDPFHELGKSKGESHTLKHDAGVRIEERKNIEEKKKSR